jgi:rhodanese-related sulfurtransferase/predicted metal-dependent enzyme (double-stranded beta helix superfamily)
MRLETDEQLVQQALAGAEKSRSGAQPRTPAELADIVSRFASSDGWMDGVRLCAEHRWYQRLHLAPDYDIWLISWLPGQSTGYHDHGASSGAFVVATGALKEHRPGERGRVIHPGKPRAFGPDYAHDVRNASLAPAISIHAYSPPLTDMNEYELDGIRLVPRERQSDTPNTIAPELRTQNGNPSHRVTNSSIDQVLAAARSRLRRLSPHEANEAMLKTGVTLVDIRTERQRAIEGYIPGALAVDRNVLEWRFDPFSSARLPVATSHDLQLIVFCSEGYTSSLAASALQDIGLHRATDMIGGFQAWKSLGLPVAPPAKTP